MKTMFYDLQKRFEKLSQKTLLFQQIKLSLQNKFIKDYVLGEIEKRLYEEGTDTNNKKLITDFAISQKQKAYSKKTQKIKTAKGQAIDKVTLADTKEFYDSFNIEIKDSYFEFIADFEKDNGNIYENFQDSFASEESFQQMTVGLSDEQKDIFIRNVILPEFINAILKLCMV